MASKRSMFSMHFKLMITSFQVICVISQEHYIFEYTRDFFSEELKNEFFTETTTDSETYSTNEYTTIAYFSSATDDTLSVTSELTPESTSSAEVNRTLSDFAPQTTAVESTDNWVESEYNEGIISSASEVIHEKSDKQSRTRSGMNCATNEIEKHNELFLANELLKKGNEEIKIQSNNSDEETILVLGNAGSGKTTFSQFMAGDNKSLMSLEVGNDTGEFVIVDGFKIGSSPIESLTLYPEQVKINSAISYTDTPGFSDTRSSSHELVATYVMKKYLENIKNIKIVLLITYNSVQYGVYKDDFINLLRNVNNFIKDIDKYKDSIVLIANKVPNTYRVTKNDVKLIPDRNIVISIAEFIHDVKVSIVQKLPTVSNSEEKIFLENAVKIIESLEEVDENGNLKKINIFRRPSELGSISSMTLLQQEKQSIQKTISNVKFSNLTGNSIGYSLSNSAKLYLNCLLQYINEKIDDMSSYIFQLINNHFKLKTENYTDIYELNSQLHSALKSLESLKNNLEESNNFTNYITKIETFITNENLNSVKINKDNFSEINDYTNVFQQFTINNYNPFSPVVWSEHLKPVISNIKDNILWSDGLIKIFQKLSSYESQKSKSELFNNTNLNYTLNSFNLIYSDSDKNININYFNGENLTESRTQELGEILTITFKEPDHLHCDLAGKLIIKGYFIKISSVINSDVLQKYCRQWPIKVIIIHAYTVFIDSDINRTALKGIKMMINAVNWQVIGQRKILIDGLPGKSHDKSKAKDGEVFGGNGENGIPGLPGENGGMFVGIGLHFKNINSLFVSTKGGDGGSGQDGGDGMKGQTGKHGYEKLDREPSSENYASFWNKGYKSFPIFNHMYPQFDLIDHVCVGELKMYHYEGDCGKAGGKGGDGGVGGIGGRPGKIKLITVSKHSDNNTNHSSHFQGLLWSFLNLSSETILSENTDGNSGCPGKGGKAGPTGDKGLSSTCYQLKYTDTRDPPTSTTYWICSNSTDNPSICTEPNLNSPDGESNSVDDGIIKPNDIEYYDFLEEYEYFEMLLKRNRNKKFLARDVMKFEDPKHREHVLDKLRSN